MGMRSVGTGNDDGVRQRRFVHGRSRCTVICGEIVTTATQISGDQGGPHRQGRAKNGYGDADTNGLTHRPGGFVQGFASRHRSTDGVGVDVVNLEVEADSAAARASLRLRLDKGSAMTSVTRMKNRWQDGQTGLS